MTISHQKKIAACLLILYWPALFVLAHIPVPRVVREADVSDKTLHFLAYLILTFLIWSAVSGDRKVQWRRALPWLVLLVISVYAVFDELLQSYISGRTSDVRDFVTDLAGAIAVLILCSFLTFWPAGLAVTAITIFGITNVTRANLGDLMPKINAVFHLFAYAILTFLWIQCMRLFYPVRASRTRWLISALAGPVGFLIAVKSFSVIAGRDFTLSEIILSFGAITAVVTLFYIRRSAHRAPLDECQITNTNWD